MPNNPHPHTHPNKGRGGVHRPDRFTLGVPGFFIIYGEKFNQRPRYHRVTIGSRDPNSPYTWTSRDEEFTDNYIDITAVVNRTRGTRDGSDDVILTIELDDGSTQQLCICDVPIDGRRGKNGKDGKRKGAASKRRKGGDGGPKPAMQSASRSGERSA